MLVPLIVAAAYFLLSTGSFNQDVDSFLKTKLSAYDKYEFEVLNVPEGDIKLIDDSGFKLSGNYAYIPIEIKYNNSGISRTYLTVKLKLFKEVLVAENDIPVKNIISADEIKTEMKEVTNLNGTPVNSPKEISGMRSKALLKKGNIIVRELLEPEPLVKSGDRVNLISTFGNVSVTTYAEARQEGTKGDLIRIVTRDKKIFKAKIIDSLNVLVTN